MARQARVILPDVPVHVIQRGNNRGTIFFGDDDRARYLEILGPAAKRHGCAVHAYVLMPNHVHLLVTPAGASTCGALMKEVGQRYAQHVNRTQGRTGTLWEGRFRSALVQTEDYLLACQRYIELNPVRARMVRHPRDYPWSSYRANADGRIDPLVTPHACYRGLGRDAVARRDAYQALVRAALAPDLLEAIRAATNSGAVLGDRRFAERIAAKLGRRVTRGRPGRPATAATEAT